MNSRPSNELSGQFPDLDLIFLESGGDNLAASIQSGAGRLLDLRHRRRPAATRFRARAAPGSRRSDLLVINKIDLAPHVGASLEVMDRDALRMRGDRPFLFTQPESRQRSRRDLCFHHS